MAWGLFLSFLTGIFFLLGISLYYGCINKKALAIFASSCAFIVILGLLVFDLLPELISTQKWYLFLFVLLGLFIVKIIDFLVPHHEHHHKASDYETKGHQEHLNHIGIITIIALIFHNFIEGIGLYSVTLNSVRSGFIFLLGIGFHNLPLGIQIGTFSANKKNIWLILLLVLSSLLGAGVVILFGSIPALLERIIIALTTGMIAHILVFELLGELINNRGQKESTYGIIVGIIILIIINLL